MLYELGPYGVFVQIHSTAPADADWKKLLDYMRKNRDSIRRVVAITRGNGGPSSKQREQLAELLKSFPPQLPFVLLSDSRIARGVLTALNWMTGRAHYTSTFGPDEMDQALDFLQLSASEKLAVRQFILRLDSSQQLSANGS